ncbi:MAG: hypothetical protein SGPRY_004214, partial [Prymnesium sp.]
MHVYLALGLVCNSLALIARPPLALLARPQLSTLGLSAVNADTLLAQSEVLEVLSQVKDATLANLAAEGDTENDLVSLGLVRSVEVDAESRDLTLSIEIPIDAASAGAGDRLKQQCEELLRSQLQWVDELSVDISVQSPAESTSQDLSPLRALADNSGLNEAKGDASSPVTPGVEKVAHIVAVASCKGGVGKSTTAVNLAYSLAAAGERVGIVDLDIHGPSLPTMARPSGGLQLDGEALLPLSVSGVKLMSMGFINPGAMPLRGAKITPNHETDAARATHVRHCRTVWGELDFLIVDLPPGTGDVQLTLSQDFKVSAAVLITTPQRLSFVDVVKGVEMFDKVGIPTVAVVENMAGFSLDALAADADAFAAKHSLSSDALTELRAILTKRVSVFGESHVTRLKDMWGIEASFSLPLLPEIASSADGGVPLVVSKPDGDAAKIYAEIADAVQREVRALSSVVLPQCCYMSDSNTIEILCEGGSKQSISPVELRTLCRSPSNQPDAVADDIFPVDMVPMGNYALS